MRTPCSPRWPPNTSRPSWQSWGRHGYGGPRARSRTRSRREADDDLPPGVAQFEVADRVGDRAQRVRAVDDRGHLAGREQLAEGGEVFAVRAGQQGYEPLAHERGEREHGDRGPHRFDPVAVLRSADTDEHALRRDGPPGLRQGPDPDRVDHQVVASPGTGEVRAGVVDDLLGAERPDQLHVAGAAYAGHLGAERLASCT